MTLSRFLSEVMEMLVGVTIGALIVLVLGCAALFVIDRIKRRLADIITGAVRDGLYGIHAAISALSNRTTEMGTQILAQLQQADSDLQAAILADAQSTQAAIAIIGQQATMIQSLNEQLAALANGGVPVDPTALAKLASDFETAASSISAQAGQLATANAAIQQAAGGTPPASGAPSDGSSPASGSAPSTASSPAS